MTPERWQAAFSNYSTSSFSEYLRHAAPHLLPATEPAGRPAASDSQAAGVPHGTTVLALRYRDGVTGAMRLTSGLRRFAIRAASDPDGSRRDLVCLVEEIKA